MGFSLTKTIYFRYPHDYGNPHFSLETQGLPGMPHSPCHARRFPQGRLNGVRPDVVKNEKQQANVKGTWGKSDRESFPQHGQIKGHQHDAAHL